jgi:hypothetical protein
MEAHECLVFQQPPQPDIMSMLISEEFNMFSTVSGKERSVYNTRERVAFVLFGVLWSLMCPLEATLIILPFYKITVHVRVLSKKDFRY